MIGTNSERELGKSVLATQYDDDDDDDIFIYISEILIIRRYFNKFLLEGWLWH